MTEKEILNAVDSGTPLLKEDVSKYRESILKHCEKKSIIRAVFLPAGDPNIGRIIGVDKVITTIMSEWKEGENMADIALAAFKNSRFVEDL